MTTGIPATTAVKKADIMSAAIRKIDASSSLLRDLLDDIQGVEKKPVKEVNDNVFRPSLAAVLTDGPGVIEEKLEIVNLLIHQVREELF